LGGTGSDGKAVTAAEIIDSATGETRVIANPGLTPRSSATATLLTDGTVFLAGGLAPNGQPLASAELWNPRIEQVNQVAGTLATARSGQRASLLPNGDVLVWGGRDAQGLPVGTAELYDPSSKAFAVISPDDSRLPASHSSSGVPSIDASLPAADALQVPVNTRVVLRLSSPLALGPGASNAISLVGPAGAVSGKAVAAEGGKLLFFTPAIDLLPGATYTTFLQGAIDISGQSFPFSTSSFSTETIQVQPSPTALPAASNGKGPSARPSRSTTVSPTIATLTTAEASPSSTSTPQQAKSPGQKTTQSADQDAGPEDWVPGERNRHGRWRVLGLPGDPVLETAARSPLTAPVGLTAIAGEVLRYNGRPISGVAVNMDGKSGVTDSRGRFLLSGLTPGVGQLELDGTGVLAHGRHYTKHFIREKLIAGATTVVPYPIYLPRVDPATEVSIPSPITKEIVLTDSEIPGLEVHIPKGVVLREYNGKIVRKVSITPIPLDRPPYPTPASFAVYFTLQPGGAFLDAPADKAIRVIYPNYQGAPPGTRLDFWNYDPEKGWQVYGQGTVTTDGKQVVPDANVGFRQIISFGMGLGPGNAPPASAPPVNGCVQGGDPVDCATGLFLHTETDLAIRDTIPISVTRTYRQNDPMSRSFGIGTNLSYNMWLYTPATATVPPEVDLILSDGSRVPYFLRSGTSLANAVWTQISTPSAFYGSLLTSFNHGSGAEGFTITLRDQTVLTFAPHAPNGILSVTDRNGNAITFTVTNATTGGTITRVTSPSGRYIQFFYDSAGRINQATDNIGRSVFYTYDAGGRLASVKDPAGNTESYGYDDSDRMATVTDKRGNVMVTNQYDSNGRVSQQTLADGAIWRFAYLLDETGNVTQTTVTDPRGVERQDNFNSDGYLTQEVRAVGRPEQQTISVQRDADNQVLSFTDALGRATQLSRDGFGNVTGITRLAGTPNALTDTFTYDSTYQQLTGYTDPLGHGTTLGLDALGNVTSVTDSLGHAVQIGNDSLGRPTAFTNALGKVTQITYNLGDLSAVTDPLGRTLSIFTDAVGRITGVSDPLGHITQYSYDAMDNVVQIKDAKGGITSLSYDQNQNLLSVEGPRNVGTYSFAYDSRNRVHTYTDPLELIATYNYDGMGNLTSKIDRKSQTTSYAYDGLDRLQTVTYADTSTITITWDAGNRPTLVADSANGTITRQYDGLDRMTEEVSPQGQVDYQYDAASRRTLLTVSGLPAIGYQYDSANRLTQIAQATTTVGLGYDAANRRTSVTLPNGVVESNSFDDADELIGINYDHGTTHLGDLTYAYDQAGRRASESGSLASLVSPSTVSSATYDANNRLTNWNGIPLTYDANGNLSSYGPSSYTWNTRDQLIGTSDGGGAFGYDAFGRRTSQTVTGVTVPYLYDGGNPATISGYMLLNGLGIDERFAETSPAGTSSYLSDALGSTIGVTDASGSMVGSYSYAPYGRTASSGSVGTPFEYTGRENDGATDLYYYRARYYISELSRFISEDPLGFGGGMNFYTYVGDEPINNVDPLGLCQQCAKPPALPYGASVKTNIQEIQMDRAFAGPALIFAFYNLVRNDGPWDYKQQNTYPQQYDAAGNFNYGATGAAAGFSTPVLLRAAGYAQIEAGTSTRAWAGIFGPFGGPPYGDDPADQAEIKAGIAYYECLASGGQ
jgi:RHS repeat-associated protein